MSWTEEVRRTYMAYGKPELDGIEDFWVYCGNLSRAFPEWRKGQVYSNALYRARPELYGRMIMDDVDPFHRDDRVTAFADWLHENWVERQPLRITAAERDIIIQSLHTANNEGTITFNQEWDITDKLFDLEFEREGN